MKSEEFWKHCFAFRKQKTAISLVLKSGFETRGSQFCAGCGILTALINSYFISVVGDDGDFGLTYAIMLRKKDIYAVVCRDTR